LFDLDPTNTHTYSGNVTYGGVAVWRCPPKNNVYRMRVIIAMFRSGQNMSSLQTTFMIKEVIFKMKDFSKNALRLKL
jgi:hypothetical protein